MTEITDSDRIDWFSDTSNTRGLIRLPREAVEQNPHNLRDAIDYAIRMSEDEK